MAHIYTTVVCYFRTTLFMISNPSGGWASGCYYAITGPANFETLPCNSISKLSGILFNNDIDLHSRRNALTGPALVVNIDPPSFPKAVQRLMVLLESFRDQLAEYYEIYKPMASQDRSFFSPDLYRKFGDIFEGAKKGLGDDQTGLWPGLLAALKTA